MTEISSTTDADIPYGGKGNVCTAERRYSHNPKEILERPKDPLAKTLIKDCPCIDNVAREYAVLQPK